MCKWNSCMTSHLDIDSKHCMIVRLMPCLCTLRCRVFDSTDKLMMSNFDNNHCCSFVRSHMYSKSSGMMIHLSIAANTNNIDQSEQCYSIGCWSRLVSERNSLTKSDIDYFRHLLVQLDTCKWNSCMTSLLDIDSKHCMIVRLMPCLCTLRCRVFDSINKSMMSNFDNNHCYSFVRSHMYSKSSGTMLHLSIAAKSNNIDQSDSAIALVVDQDLCRSAIHWRNLTLIISDIYLSNWTRANEIRAWRASLALIRNTAWLSDWCHVYAHSIVEYLIRQTVR